MPNAAKRHQTQTRTKAPAKKAAAKSDIKTAQEVVTATKAKDETPAAPKGKKPSIRQLIRSGLLANKPVKEITKELQEQFPGTAAANKSSKHIGYYKSLMVKAGELTKVSKSVKAAVTAADAVEA